MGGYQMTELQLTTIFMWNRQMFFTTEEKSENF